jgi:hypothetical protein
MCGCRSIDIVPHFISLILKGSDLTKTVGVLFKAAAADVDAHRKSHINSSALSLILDSAHTLYKI